MKNGIILLNKPAGITSFDALRDIKRTHETGKVGHTGTLDKFASGLLVVLVGRDLKLSQWFSACDKQYSGRIHFGIETDTLDPEGKVTAEVEIPEREEVEQVLKTFTGTIMQTPPAFSAIHVNGKRASVLARSGNVPQMKERKVTIHKLELRSWQPPYAEIFVHCSSGTYIRSLARDIALAAGSRAHLCSLLRTQVAGFRLEDAGESSLLRPVDKSVFGALGMPWFEIEPLQAQMIKHGKPLDGILDALSLQLFRAETRGHEEGTIKTEESSAAVFCGETLTAIVEKKNGRWNYGCVLN
ncbi:MAG: tRNA pseudouridine(55) synthase TruB [Treponema sp.]|jgi:tRNA pseudouridine55 synthase|nr:tRNA pseudouridine(55) synthase TruB [Treponema sp.]